MLIIKILTIKVLHVLMTNLVKTFRVLSQTHFKIGMLVKNNFEKFRLRSNCELF